MTAMVVNEADGRPAFRVAVFGMAQKFQRILEIVLKHARHNQYRYVVTPSRGPGEYDIAMVDMTAKGGYEVAATLKRLPSGRPIVTVGRRSDPARGRDDLLQATFTMDVLKALNGVVEQQYTRAQRPVVWLQDPPGASGGEPAARHNAPQHEAAQRPLSRPQPSLSAAASSRPAVPPASVSTVEPTGLTAAPDARLPAHALVIDDSPTVRRQLAVALSQIGVTSETVDNAKAALAAMARFRYDIVFVDVVMPDMDGLRLIREIKRDRAARDMPIVILTSRSSPFDLARGALAGCSSYLVKPVSLKTLHTTVQRHLERQQARRRQAAETHPA